MKFHWPFARPPPTPAITRKSCRPCSTFHAWAESRDGPKKLPDALYADRGYDSDAARALLAWLGIEPNIARRNSEHGSGLGKVRWVVERTIVWLKSLGRMRVRYDRLKVIQVAWNTLAAAVISFRIVQEAAAL